MPKLKNIRRETFAQEYLKGGNASEAFRIAYPSSLKWKQETVNKRASEVLKIGEVLGRVEELRFEAKERNMIETDDIVQLLADVIFDRREVIDYVETIETAGGEMTASTVTKRRSMSKSAAIERLCKMLGLDKSTKMEIAGKDGSPLMPQAKPLTQQEARDFIRKLEEEY